MIINSVVLGLVLLEEYDKGSDLEVYSLENIFVQLHVSEFSLWNNKIVILNCKNYFALRHWIIF